MRFIIFKLLLILVFFVQPGIAKAGDNSKLTLVLDWFANANHAPIILAEERGLFKKYGLDVKVIQPADPSDPPKWVATNKADLALDYQPHVVIERAAGLPIQQIGTLVDHPLNSLVVLGSSPVKQLSDLKHQTIAYSSPEIDLIILTRMLQKTGISLSDVTAINVHYSLVQGLISKRVAAAIGLMRNIELVELQVKRQQVRAFFPEDYGIPPYSELVFITKQGRNDNRFVQFFAALNEAQRYLSAHPLESYQAVLRDCPEFNNPAGKAMWLKTVPEFARDFSRVDRVQYERTRDFFTSVRPLTTSR